MPLTLTLTTHPSPLTTHHSPLNDTLTPTLTPTLALTLTLTPTLTLTLTPKPDPNQGASELLTSHGFELRDAAWRLSSVVPKIISVDFATVSRAPCA